MIVVCAYCGYKGLDNYSLYAVQVLGMNELEAAQFTAASAYMRPPAAVAAGLLADRLTARKVIGGLFVLLALSYSVLGQLSPSPQLSWVLYANIFVSFFGVFGLRGVYFALLEETKVPRARTGAAVGLVSVVGYTPDVFYAPIAGRLLDRSPGVLGHQHNFLLLAAIALVGLGVVLLLTRIAQAGSTPNEAEDPERRGLPAVEI
jgi:MFS family permease